MKRSWTCDELGELGELGALILLKKCIDTY